MNYTIIQGTGSAVPEHIVTNEDLSAFLETDDTWIRTRTGIGERRIAKTESLTELCVKAARQAVEAAGITAGELDLIIAATLTPDSVLPNMSSCIQKELGAERAICFDIGAACSGFIFAMNTARMYIQSGEVKHALVIGGEILSKIMDWTDRSTCVLFGDGAGAAVLGASKEKVGILAADIGTDGSKGSVLRIDPAGISNPFRKEEVKPSYVKMEGQEVFKFAVSTVPGSIERTLEKAGMTVKDVDVFLLHQANMRIIQSVAKRLKAPREKFLTNLEHYGNTSAASIPILLDEAIRNGQIRPGSCMILSGFGGGLTWGSVLIQM